MRGRTSFGCPEGVKLPGWGINVIPQVLEGPAPRTISPWRLIPARGSGIYRIHCGNSHQAALLPPESIARYLSSRAGRSFISLHQVYESRLQDGRFAGSVRVSFKDGGYR